MSKIEISLGCAEYDRTRPLIEGKVRPKGLRIIPIVGSLKDIFRRMLKYLEFDVSEMSMSSYLIAKQNRKPMIAIPVFPSRKFRHSSIYCNANAGIEEPSDLKGKKIGVYDYQMTAAVWIRGILQHDYDIAPKSLKWFIDRESRQEYRSPKDVSINKIPMGRELEEMLVSGDLNALIAAAVPKCVIEGSPKIKRLFQNFEEVELGYYQRTKIFPIMHTVVLKERLWEKHRWIAPSLLSAFEESKQMAYLKYTIYRTTNNDNEFSYPWVASFIEKQMDIFGPDPYPYNIKDNEKTLKTLIQYSFEQGFIHSEPELETLFAENTLD